MEKPELQLVAENNHRHHDYSFWLDKHHIRIFEECAPANMDYVTIVSDSNGKIRLKFFQTKSKLLKFLKKHKLSAYGYRKSHEMILMY